MPFLLILVLLIASGLPARAEDTELDGDEVVIRVDISDQRVRVNVAGWTVHEFKVSTGARGYATPPGYYRPYRMHTMWHSRTYDNAPMPHSVFFHEGYALHATGAIGRLGNPASHGCVRLHPDHAEIIFSLVRRYGMKNTLVIISE